MGWQDQNSSHLEAGIAWVRGRLRRAAEALAASPAEPNRAARGRGQPRWPLLGKPSSQAASDQASADEETARQACERIERTMDPPPALAMLAERLGLSHFERDVLLLCAALELDTRVGPLCAQAQDDPARPFPTFALALSVFDQAEWSALTPERPLRAWRLLDVHQPSATPLIAAALRIDERIVHYLKGLNTLDDRLASLVWPLRRESGAAELAPSQLSVSREVVRAWRDASEAGEPLPAIELLGGDPTSQRLVAGDAARAAGVVPFVLRAEDISTSPAEVEALARLWKREARLMPLALYLDVGDATDPASTAAAHPHRSGLDRFVAWCDGFVFIASREPSGREGRPIAAFDVAKPTTGEQVAAWQAALGPGSEAAARRLAGQFHLNLPAIARIARSAAAALPPDAPAEALAEAAWERCRLEVRPRVDGLAQRIEPVATWSDLVLPAEPAAMLRRVASHVRHRATVFGDWGFERVMSRGQGLCALFCGPSGTGKTMAAEVLAVDLKLDLFRIDLSSVVSKYIGETEKNLRRLFDRFEESGAILFFDEADSLFGRRSEVRDSHDRYANIEVNYLLQRIETYRGLAILATNRRAALDEAFLRRLRFIVEFPLPTAAERRRIWSGVFPRPEAPPGPGGVPTVELDPDRLAWLDLTGGHIRNAALGAAFRAAEAEGLVTMTDVLASSRDEYVKLERTIHEPEFHWAPSREREGAP